MGEKKFRQHCKQKKCIAKFSMNNLSHRLSTYTLIYCLPSQSHCHKFKSTKISHLLLKYVEKLYSSSQHTVMGIKYAHHNLTTTICHRRFKSYFLQWAVATKINGTECPTEWMSDKYCCTINMTACLCIQNAIDWTTMVITMTIQKETCQREKKYSRKKVGLKINLL